MLDPTTIQKELSEMLKPYPEVSEVTYRPNMPFAEWTILTDERQYFNTLTEVINHLETKYGKR